TKQYTVIRARQMATKGHSTLSLPDALPILDAAREAGAWAVTISGSGSGLIAACEPVRAEDVAAAMADAFRRAAGPDGVVYFPARSEEHTSELQSRENLVCRLLLEKKKQKHT